MTRTAPLDFALTSSSARPNSVFDRTGKAFYRVFSPIQKRVGGLCGTIGSALFQTAQRVAIFVKNNWKTLLANAVALGIIITCAGFINGFQAVALPLTIGMSCGMAMGVLVGIATVKIFDKNNEFKGRNSAWGLLNAWIEYLHKNGLRQILFPIAMAVMLAVTVIFPYAVGGVLGIFIGNQLAIQTGYPPDRLWKKKFELDDQTQKCKKNHPIFTFDQLVNKLGELNLDASQREGEIHKDHWLRLETTYLENRLANWSIATSNLNKNDTSKYRQQLQLIFLKKEIDQLRIDITGERYEQPELPHLVVLLKEEIKALMLKENIKVQLSPSKNS